MDYAHSRLGAAALCGALSLGIVLVAPGGVSSAATAPGASVHRAGVSTAATSSHRHGWYPRRSLRLTVTKHRVRGPAHTHPGLAKIHIVSWTGQRASVLMFRPRLHQTNTRLAKDLTTFSSTSSPRRLQHDFRNVGGADTGKTMYLHLRKGMYFAVVPRKGVVKRSSVYRLRVAGTVQNARNPKSSVVISTGTHKVKWAPKPVSMPRSGVLKFVNRGHVVSDLYIEQLKLGITLADVRRWFVDPKQPKPSPFTWHHVAVGALSPHSYEKLVYNVPPGKYVLVNFWVDKNGDPIALQGMLRTIHLV